MRLHRLASCLVAAVCAVSLCGPAHGQYAQSTFDNDSEGWVTVDTPGYGNPPYDPPMAGPYTPTHSVPCISQADPTGYLWHWQAPVKFLGDQSGAYGRSLKYGILQIVANGTAINEADVILVGAGLVLVIDSGANPSSTWSQRSVTLSETAGWKKGNLSGAAPTQAEFKAVLASLSALRIRGEYISGADECGLREVVLESATNISSGFDTNDDGWKVVDLNTNGSGPYDPIVGSQMTPVFNPAGNPGGCTQMEDPSTNLWFWQAPAKFLGDKSAAYGTSLEYDLKQLYASGTPLTTYPDVILAGAGMVLVTDAGPNPLTTWTHYTVPLTETSGWRITSLAGPVPTKEQFQAVLASLTALRIRGEFIDGGDKSAIDNVTLVSVPPVTTIPAAKAAANGTPVMIKAALVSAVFPNAFYIEADDRACGIRVEKAGHSVAEGTRVDVTGSVSNNPQGERCISSDIAP